MHVTYCTCTDIPIDESGVDDSSLLSPDHDSPSSHSIYRPVLVDIPRFQKLMEQHEQSGDTREDGSPLVNSGTQSTNGIHVELSCFSSPVGRASA